MHQLVQGILGKFVADQQLDGLDLEEQFERLAGWCVLSPHLPAGATLEDTMAGNETVGIDSVAIVIGDDLVLDADDVREIAEGAKTIDADLVFIQAKTSESFSRAEILNFGESVCAFFSPEQPVESVFIKTRREAKDTLYAESSKFRNRRPRLSLSFVTTGKVPVGDQNITQALDGIKYRLRETDLFDAVEFVLIGAADLHKRFSALEHREEATISFSRRVSLPRIPGVKEAFVGVVEATEFLKLVQDEDSDNIKTSVFYDNVRDFQDLNPVNAGMLETLEDSGSSPLFPVMNNGVTVVAKEIRPVGDDVTIEDYQIVNGCQTSHVLFAARESLTSDVLVPLRLVVTEEDQVASLITKATNRQTPVEEGSLQALTDYQKELESFFGAQTGKKRLFYERRSRQYSGQSVEQTRVIPPATAMRAFVAVVLDEPHSASRYYRRLYERVPTAIFNPEQRHELYYVSSLAWYRLDVALRRKQVAAELRPVRYHVLTAARHLAAIDPMPPHNSAKVGAWSAKFADLLVDEQASVQLFKAAGKKVLDAGGGSVSRDTAKRERFTRELLDTL